ncbi:MAG: choice-of-anchor J domain-containing protein [Planctomycetes bacterium]|nr:choice-of-anchor J domain-containing protein [Planctomycetota bacterium]
MTTRRTYQLVVEGPGMARPPVIALCCVLLFGVGAALAPAGAGPTDALNFGISAQAAPILYQDFESGPRGWYSDNGVWELGVPASGPGAAHNGLQCAATILAGNYPYTTDSRLISPSVLLPPVTADEEIWLRFWQWFSYAWADSGSVQIQVFDGAAWKLWEQVAVRAVGVSGGWSFTCVDLTAYAGQRVRLAFYHQDETEKDGWGGNIHAESSGWYIDQIEIVKQTVQSLAYRQSFESGCDGWYATKGVWQIGEPNSALKIAHEGTCVAGTVLAGDYPYTTDSHLVSPTMQLPAVSENEEILLRFWQWFSYAWADSGSVQIQVFDGALWKPWEQVAVRAVAVSGGWSLTCVDLTAYAGQRVRIGFYHQDETEKDGWGGNIHAESSGWYIDEVEVITQTIPWFDGFEDFESGGIGWCATNGVWQVGLPVYGPLGAHQGTSVAGTVLDGTYPYTTDSWLVSPPMRLPVVLPGEEVMLFFWQWFAYAPSDAGSVWIQVYDGTAWKPWEKLVVRAVGSGGAWGYTGVELTTYAGQRVRIGFYHQDETERDGWGGNIHAESSGWYIDDVEIVPPPQHDPNCGLSISVSGPGTTDPAPGDHEYLCGQVVSVTAVTDDCHPFVRWEGTAVDAGKVQPGSTSRTITVTVDQRYTLKAVFTDDVVLYAFPLDKDPGWLRTGQWAFGVPKGKGGDSHGSPDPTAGATGPNVLGANLDGDHAAQVGGPYCLTAGPFALGAFKEVKVRFARWLNTDWPEFVKVGLQLSVDGQKTWSSVWSHDASRTEITEREWTIQQYNLGPQADGQSVVYLRWYYNVVGERAYAFSGWNLDDIELIGKCK